jgi:hypothetical protein
MLGSEWLGLDFLAVLARDSSALHSASAEFIAK